MKYELTQEDKDALFALLNRVNLTGHEVPAFNKLINIFQNPIKEEEKENKNE